MKGTAMGDAKVKATIYLPVDVHRKLKIRAAEEGNTMTDLVAQAVVDLLRRPPVAKSRSLRSSGTEAAR